VAFPTQTTTYNVVVIDGNDCRDTAEVTVEVLPLPVANIQGPDFSCRFQTVQLLASGGSQVLWEDGSTNFTRVVGIDTTDAEFVLQVVSVEGCIGQPDTLRVRVDANPPVAAFRTVRDTIAVENPLQVVNSSTNALSYAWTYGRAGASSTEQAPVLVFSELGVQSIRLVATNAEGCRDTLTASVLVISDFVSVPNVFTPNGDGFNDFFAPYTGGLLGSYRMHIFDRWGKRVWFTDASQPWDGTTPTGELAAAGVYFYNIEARLPDGKVIVREGHVTLVR
jgi:gliding motility-associated-like protein